MNGVEIKGSGVFSHEPLGRPRGRKVDSIPKRFAMRPTQLSSPNGRPRFTLIRSASNSDAVCGRFTLVVQSFGRSMGQSLSQDVKSGSVCACLHKLDHCQPSARSASFARTALRSTYRQKMFIGPHGKRLKSALIDRPGAGAMMMRMPPLGMRDRDPAEHLGEFAIMPRPQEEVPMIRHEAIGRDANLGLNVGLSENFLKRSIVRRLLEQLESVDTAIQDMIGEVPGCKARPAWHGGACTETSIFMSRKRLPTPFFSPAPGSMAV